MSPPDFTATGPHKKAWRDRVISEYRRLSGAQDIPYHAAVLTLGGPQWIDSEYKHMRRAGLISHAKQYVSVERDPEVSERNADTIKGPRWVQGKITSTYLPAQVLDLPAALISLDMMCGAKEAAAAADNLLYCMCNSYLGARVLAVNCILRNARRPYQKYPSPAPAFAEVDLLADSTYQYKGDGGSVLHTSFFLL